MLFRKRALIVTLIAACMCFWARAQNIGIGTQEPQNKLDIYSSDSTDSHILLGLVSPTSARARIQFSEWQTAVPGSGMSIEYDGSEWVGDDNRMYINSVVNSVPRFTFVGKGFLGIATTNPFEPLEIAGSGRAFFGDGGGVTRTGLLIDGNEPGRYVRIQPYDYGTYTSMPLFIPNQVQVGFGTTNPDTSALIHMASIDKGFIVPRMLQEHKDSIYQPAEGLLVYQMDQDTGFWYRSGDQWNRLSSVNESMHDRDKDTWISVESVIDEDMIRLKTNNADRLVVTSQGKVGIGVSDPNHTVEFGNNNIEVFIGDGEGESRRGILLDPTNSGNYVVIAGKDYGGGNPDVCIPNDVFIGPYTTSTTFELEVSGQAAKSSGSSWTVVSDKRFKKDIQPYTDGLDQLVQIQPVTFKYNDRSAMNSDMEHVGVIAQDLEQIAPYMIDPFTRDNEEYLAVNNSAMTYMLINAIKDQQRQIDELKSQLEDLQSELER